MWSVSWRRLLRIGGRLHAPGACLLSRSYGNRPYFVPDDPATYERLQRAWSRERPPVATHVPAFEAEWPEGHAEVLLGAAAGAGLPERLAERVVRGAARGQAPDDPEKLAARIRQLYELQTRLPGLDVERMLQRSTLPLTRSPTDVARRLRYLTRQLDSLPPASLGALLTAAPRWLVHSPRELVDRVRGAALNLEELTGMQQMPDEWRGQWRAMAGVSGPSANGLRSKLEFLARHMGADATAALLRRSPYVLSRSTPAVRKLAAALSAVTARPLAASYALLARCPRLLALSGGQVEERTLRLAQLMGEGGGGGGAAERAAPAPAAAADAGGGGGGEEEEEEGEVVGRMSNAALRRAARVVFDRAPTLWLYRPEVLEAKLRQLRFALDLSPAGAAAVARGAPAALTRSEAALKATVGALASIPDASPVSLTPAQLSALLAAAPPLLTLTQRVLSQRVAFVEGAAALGPAWAGHVMDVARSPEALGAVLAAKRERWRRLRWLLEGQRQAEPSPGLVELVQMQDEAFLALHPGWSREGRGGGAAAVAAAAEGAGQ